MAKIVGIKFNHAFKVYYFDPGTEFYKEGTGVIVETARGLEFGQSSPDEDEFLECERIPFKILLDMVRSDKIPDSKTQIAILKTNLLIQSE